MKRQRLLWLFICLFSAGTSVKADGLFQQGTPVSGTVTDEEGKPLAGVTVSARGEAASTLTDAGGHYRLTVAGQRSVLEFTFVGFEKASQTVGRRGIIDLGLKAAAAKDLDEVVIVGYGTQKKRDLTGSIASVKAADITRSPTGNALEAIQGMVPGADITRSSGKANAGVNVLIRGTHTINGGTDPLYIIDGVQGGSPSSINPNDYESIEVLKDASSTAIYGSQGANGVIILTTKKGKAGKTKVNYNGYYGVDGWAEYPTPRMGDSYIQLRREAYRTTGVWNSPADDSKIFSAAEKSAIAANQWVNWVDLLLHNGTRQNHSISVSGGSEKTKAYFSGGFYKDDGMLKFNNLTQYNGLLNIDHTVNSWFKAGMQGRYMYSNANTRSSDPFSRADYTTPLGRPYDSLGQIISYPLVVGTYSPLADDRGPLTATNNAAMSYTSFSAHIDIEPIRGLSFRSLFGANITGVRTGQFFDSTSLEKLNNSWYTYAYVGNENIRFYNWDNILNWTKTIGDHSFAVTALTSYTHKTDEVFEASGINLLFSSQLFYNLAGTSTTNRTINSKYIQTDNMSYAGRINYSWKGRYLLQLTERIDGASILSEHHKWAAFPSIALGWRISDEQFMKKYDWLSNLKLRASYGVAGNSGIPAYGTQSYLLTQNMGFENTGVPAYVFNTNIGNTDVGWELSKTTNVGFDLGLFRNRLSVTADLYNVNTDDILLLRSLPPNLGVTTTYQNIGSSRNRGIELAITSQNVHGKDFQWSTTLNFTSNQEKITSLVNGKDIIDGSSPETASRLLGRPVNSFYNYKKLGIWQTADSGKASTVTFGSTPFAPGYIRLQDINGDNKITPDSDRVYIGAPVPKWSAGFMNTFTYKGIDLSIYILARWGQMIKDDILGRYNPAGEGNNGPAYFNYWTPENPTNDYPRPRANTGLSYYPGNTTLNYVDGSYIKLKTISLGYTFPVRLTHKWMIDNLRAYVTANNILVVTKSHLLKDYDPERGGSEDAPLTRQVVFGLNVGF